MEDGEDGKRSEGIGECKDGIGRKGGDCKIRNKKEDDYEKILRDDIGGVEVGGGDEGRGDGGEV